MSPATTRRIALFLFLGAGALVTGLVTRRLGITPTTWVAPMQWHLPRWAGGWIYMLLAGGAILSGALRPLPAKLDWKTALGTFLPLVVLGLASTVFGEYLFLGAYPRDLANRIGWEIAMYHLVVLFLRSHPKPAGATLFALATLAPFHVHLLDHYPDAELQARRQQVIADCESQGGKALQGADPDVIICETRR
jgi:hypothetical protein